jgi:hypothetical protein
MSSKSVDLVNMASSHLMFQSKHVYVSVFAVIPNKVFSIATSVRIGEG